MELSRDQVDKAITGIRPTEFSRDQADGALGYAAVPRADLAADAPPLCRYAKHPASLIRHQRAGSEQREPKTEQRKPKTVRVPTGHRRSHTTTSTQHSFSQERTGVNAAAK